jgi:hypothetical protein
VSELEKDRNNKCVGVRERGREEWGYLGGRGREGGGEIGDILVKYFLPNVLVTCCFGNRCDQSPIKLEWDNFKVNSCSMFNKLILFESF